MPNTKRMTAAQAIVAYLIAEGVPYVLGIFGHGNVQLGEALAERSNEIRFIQVKNEQNAAHLALGYARHTGKPLAVTTSIGPGATNLVTGAAVGKVGRLPVLLLPGDAFSHGVGPALQQIEGNADVDARANDTLKPVSVYWKRINRPEELQHSLREAFERMLNPSERGPAVLCLPMDVQAEAHDFDVGQLQKPRSLHSIQKPDSAALDRAAKLIADAKRPIVIAGGGVIVSEAWQELGSFVHTNGIPVVHSHGGNGSLLWDDPLNLFAAGPSGTQCGNNIAVEADLIIGIGIRYDDFTTSSETLFARDARFININVNAFDVAKENPEVKLLSDAKLTLIELAGLLAHRDMRFKNEREAWRERAFEAREAWLVESDRLRMLKAEDGALLPQSTVIGIVNDFMEDTDVLVAAAGSLPGDLLKLWRCKDPTRKQYHLEYDYSTMGYEISGAMGVKLADTKRNVYALLGDGSFMMAPQELLTAVQERIAITAVVFDSRGHRSIQGCQEGNGFQRFGTQYRMRNSETGLLDGDHLPYDLVAIASGFGAKTFEVFGADEIRNALIAAKQNNDRPSVIVIRVDPERVVGNYGGWWDVPRPQMSGRPELRTQHTQYARDLTRRTVR